jgi:hypothetical protein
MGVAKNLYVGGTLNVTGSTSFTNPVINNIKMGYTTTATAAGTTTLTVASNYRQFFTGSTTQTIVLPVTSTLVTGMAYEIENNSTGLLTVNSSGGNLVGTIPAGVCAHAVCIGTTLTTAADWDWDYISTTTITGTGANVLGTSPTITTPTISSLSSAAATALTLQSAGTTAVTIDTSQNVGIGTTSPQGKLQVYASANDNLIVTSHVNATDGPAIKTMDSTATNYKSCEILSAELRLGGQNNILFGTSGTGGSTERMRIDSSGNVGIGSSTITSADGSAGRILKVSGATNTVLVGETTGNGGFNALILEARNSNRTNARFAQIQMQTTSTAIDGGLISFSTSATGTGTDITERMRILSDGKVLVGCTSAYSSIVQGIQAQAAGSASLALSRTSDNGAVARFFSTSTEVGNISITGSATAYNTSSDYRLKENILPMTGGLAKVVQLKPCTFKWKSDGVSTQGFIAHELQAVVPDAVTGAKDATREEEYEVTPAVKDEEGNITTPAVMGTRTVPVYQGIDTSFLVATLTAAIQELKAINDTQAETINALTARITALEAKA